MKKRRLYRYSQTPIDSPVEKNKLEIAKEHLFSKIVLFSKGVINLIFFIIIVAVFVINKGINWLLKLRFMSPVKNKLGKWIDITYTKIMSIIDPEPQHSFNRSYLIELSLSNMKAKKTRTLVTMGGMAIGMAFIVFLVSVGYGLQSMVVSRVARLDELKQADVVPGMSSDLILDDSSLSNFSTIPNVKSAMPIIAVVGRISYQQSVSDMAVYGVTTDYLKNSAIQPTQGKIFEDANAVSMVQSNGQVAGASTTLKTFFVGDKIGPVDFEIEPTSWLRVRESASPTAKIIGYTRKVEGSQSGTEIVGKYYTNPADSSTELSDSDGNKLGKWIKTMVPLWQKGTCDNSSNAACEDGMYSPIINDQGGQGQSDGFIAELSMKITKTSVSTPKVLGLSTDNNSNGSLPIVDIASESAIVQETQNKIVEVSPLAKKVAVVNRSVLQVLNLSEGNAVGKKVTLTFVVVGDLTSDSKDKIESAPTEYTIIGVIPDEGTPMVYVPFLDLRSLGITKYSQIKLIVADPGSLSKVRSTIEARGYGTVSVADTVTQIDNLFSSFRLILAVLGMVALSVAALGMFNTLTVSLLERTREVGLMKAMGMKSSEVKDLFLTESMIMGFFGGVIGLFMGTLAGKLLSLILTAFSLIKGVGTVDISYVPPVFVATVLILSVLVGILTGYFPARRATKISALNALRYE